MTMAGSETVKLSEGRWYIEPIPGSDVYRIVRAAIGGEECIAAWVELEIAMLLASAMNWMERQPATRRSLGEG
jgi:hypothetical protein